MKRTLLLIVCGLSLICWEGACLGGEALQAYDLEVRGWYS